MGKFGFNIAQTRAIKLTPEDLEKVNKLLELVPSYKRCISCGGCTATCSARQYTDFNIRKTHCYFRRGQFDLLEKELQKCMLCGKCTLVCPRGVNLRSLIINMRQTITNTNETLW